MKNSITHSVLFVLGIAVLALGQTPATVRGKYGPPDQRGRYTARDGIALEATFDGDGYPMAMTIKPFDPEGVMNSPRKVRRYPKTMNKDIALEILKELVPSNTRGKQSALFVESHGCTSIKHEEHERVIISITSRCEAQGGGTYAVHIQWRNKRS